MEDSIQFLPSPPEVIQIDDTEDDKYNYEDDEVEILELESKFSSKVKGRCGRAPAGRRGVRSSLTGRRVVSPSDEVQVLIADEDKDKEKVPGPELDVNPDLDLSIVEIIQIRAPAPAPASPININNYSFISAAPLNFTPSSSSSPASSTASSKAKKKALRRKVLLDRRHRKKQQQQLSGAGLTPKSARRRGKRVGVGLGGRLGLGLGMNRSILGQSSSPFNQSRSRSRGAESQVQQNLRKLCSGSVSVTGSTGIVSSISLPIPGASASPGNVRFVPNTCVQKSLKRLRNNQLNAGAQHGTGAGAGPPRLNRRPNPNRGSGRFRRSGSKSKNNSNQENIVTSTSPNVDNVNTQHAQWTGQGQNEVQGQGQSNSNLPIARNQELHNMPMPSNFRSKYGDSHSWKNPGRTEGLGLGMVSRSFELRDARFQVPAPVTFTVDNLHTGVFGSNYAQVSSQSQSVPLYNPMGLFAQAKGQSSTGPEQPKLSLSVFGENMYAPSTSALQQKPGTLRPIVIDGSNVAMGHGNNAVFSCLGIRLCVNYFQARGHETIIAFVPHYKGPRGQVVGADILDVMEKEGIVKYTPGRMVDGKRISAYDDRFIVQCAAQIGGIIISNDHYRDLYDQEPSWRDTIDKRLLQYTWVTPQMLVFANDPLGRKGPKLDALLRF